MRTQTTVHVTSPSISDEVAPSYAATSRRFKVLR